MKLKITEIEASAEELRQCNSIADGLTRLLRNAFKPYYDAEMEDADTPQTERSE